MIISVVGSGGKSSFIKDYVKTNKEKYQKILITTSTKMFKEQLSCYDEFYTLENLPNTIENKIYAVCSKIDDNKCIGISQEYFSKIYKKFDLIIIEADGSNQKIFKLQHKENEPVIFKETTNVVGIVNMTILNCLITNENTHNYHLTTEKKYTMKVINDWINRDDGLFKNAGNIDKYVHYINKERCEKDE